MSDIFTALIIDDERRARRDLRTLLSEYAEIDIVGEADNIATAVEMIKLLKPDVVFLDIQLPGETGFKLFELIDVDFQVIFVTAFDNYAIRAFEVNALDYLLKPVNPSRLNETIARITRNQDHLLASRDKHDKRLDKDDYVFVKEQGKANFIKVASIVIIHAQRDYTEISLDNGTKRLVLKPLIEWESILPEQLFIRVHRSIMINIQYVDRLESWFNNSYRVHLRSFSEPIITSRRYTTKLREKFD